MIEKLKTMIYPFDVESAPLIRYKELIEDYDIKYAVSLNGWGLNKKDVCCTDNGEATGVIISNNFDEILENCDAVFFNQSEKDIDLDKCIYPKIIKSAEKKKHIVCTIELKSSVLEKVTELCKKNNKTLKYFTNKLNKIVIPKDEEIFQIDTPIIFVTGVSERTNKFEIQLNLRKEICEMGYKVSQIGTRNYCELMGFHSFPKFMYNNSLSETNKVVLFNYYVKSISVEEKADVIIIGVPGGIMPFDRKNTNKFGILAYEVSQAVSPDVSILSLLYEDELDGNIDFLDKSCEYKLGFNIDCYNLSNVMLDYYNNSSSQKQSYITIDHNFINENINKFSSSKNPIFNCFDREESKKIAEVL